VKALEDRSCCLLANHGVIATGRDLQKALWLAGEVETLAKQYVLARSLGQPQILPDDEIAVVVEKFKSYGPRAKTGQPAAKPSPRRRRSDAAKKTARKRSAGTGRGGKKR
jgi:L-fuculose-phosphate aldolase